jgi:hypothetical protein
MASDRPGKIGLLRDGATNSPATVWRDPASDLHRRCVPLALMPWQPPLRELEIGYQWLWHLR